MRTNIANLIKHYSKRTRIWSWVDCLFETQSESDEILNEMTKLSHERNNLDDWSWSEAYETSVGVLQM